MKKRFWYSVGEPLLPAPPYMVAKASKRMRGFKVASSARPRLPSLIRRWRGHRTCVDGGGQQPVNAPHARAACRSLHSTPGCITGINSKNSVPSTFYLPGITVWWEETRYPCRKPSEDRMRQQISVQAHG